MEGFTGHHTTAGCGCVYVPAPDEELLSILERGKVPMLCCQLIDGRFKLTYTEMREVTTCVAISHLWADGLGNTEAHAIPYCQLERIVGYVNGVEDARLKKARPRRKSRPRRKAVAVFLWLDIYCVPLPKTPRTTRLKLQAMEQMPLIYSRSAAVLILDKELEEASELVDPEDLQIRLRISAYHNRYWTLQEAALSKPSELYVVSGRCVIPVERSLDDPIPRHGLEIGDVIRSMLGFRREQSHPRSYRALRLIEVWNALLGKTSTKRGELHAILASLLDISATRVLALPVTDRIKAILCNYKHLPLDMVFSASSRGGNTTLLRAQVPQHSEDEDRWLPQLPGGSPIKIHRSDAGVASHAHLEDTGLRIPANLPRLRLFSERSELPPWESFVLAGHDIWVETAQMDEYQPPSASGRGFYLLHESLDPASFASRGYQGTGARLILKRIIHTNDNKPQYSFIFDRALIFGVASGRSQELGDQHQAVIVDEVQDRPAIIFECATRLQPGFLGFSSSLQFARAAVLGSGSSRNLSKTDTCTFVAKLFPAGL
ncbi:hypothetical protein LTR17_014080 [Elasticomyces elasticus]|nr:hypothetical protein LTR17_014080 [Elasticomyces elasticus]